MFTKASLVLIVALLVAILVNQRSQGVVQAQNQIEYKVVDTRHNLGFEPARPIQDMLDEYGTAGWQLVAQSFFPDSRFGSYRERLIFMRK